MELKETKKRARASTPTGQSLEGLKPTCSFEIPLTFLKDDAGNPQKRAEAAQAIADKVFEAVKSLHPQVAGACMVGDSGRVWTIGTSAGRAKVSYKNAPTENVKLEFFGFEPASEVVKATREALKEFS